MFANGINEQLVKKQLTIREIIKRSVVIIATLILTILCKIYVPVELFTVSVIILLFFSYTLLSKTNIEYEYIQILDDLVIDIIYNKRKRKNIITIPIKKIIRIEKKIPEIKAKIIDCSSNKNSINNYEILVNINNKKTVIKITPNDKILLSLKRK